MVIVPATVPVCTPMLAVEAVEPALMVTLAVRPPVENWMFGSSAPDIGVKVSVRFIVTSTGYDTVNVTGVVDCVAGFAVGGNPVKTRAGATGNTADRVTVSLAFNPLLSVTVTVIAESPSAVGVPPNVPVELIVTPAGNPVAVHV